MTVPTVVETVSPLALVISPKILPVKVELSEILSVKVELSPTRISPLKVCESALSVAIFDAPLQPSSQTDNKTLLLSALVMVTLLRLITALVLVTWKTCPLLLLRVPPLIEKVEVPSAASPLCD